MRLTTRLKALGAAAVLLAAGGATYLRLHARAVAKVGRGDIVREVVGPGIVEPASERVSLGFDMPGRVVEVAVEEGARVEAGQLLAHLDDRLPRARVAQAEAALARARARRDLALRGPRAAELRAAEADAEAARALARDRDGAKGRSDRLVGPGAISQAEADQARDAADAARATLAASEARLEAVREGERDELRRDAIAAVQFAEAELEQARALLAQTELRAPRAGVVLRRMIEPGEQVTLNPPKVALVLADVDHLLVRAEIDEADVALVEVGQRGFVTAEAYGPRRFPVHVVRIQRELGRKTARLDDPHARTDTRVLEVEVELDEPADLPIGLRMDAHLSTLERRQVLLVGLAAVQTKDGRAEVTVIDGGGEVKRAVELGADDGTRAEVVRGLTEGDAVVVPRRAP